MTHDLQVAEIFLRYRACGLDVLQCWVGEDVFPRRWRTTARPDALLLDAQGKFLRAVEYGGDYTPQRMWTLHRALAYVGLSYEIW
jgi:hypothetical protein